MSQRRAALAKDDAVVCPVCYHSLRAGMNVCPNCGSTIPEETAEVLGNLLKIAGVGPDEAKILLEEGLGVSEEDQEEIEDLLKEVTGGEVLYLCPACGSFLSERTPNCPGCGDEVSERERLEAPPPPEEDETSLFMCPECGAFVTEEAERCTYCGAGLETEGEPEVEPLADAVQVGDIAAMDEDVFLCPTCGAFVEVDAATCDICGTDLKTHKAIAAGVGLTAEERGPVCENCGALLRAPGGECKICGSGAPAEDAATPPEEGAPPEVVFLEEEIDSFIAELESPATEESPALSEEELLKAEAELAHEPAPEASAEAAARDAARPSERVVLKPISAPATGRGWRPEKGGFAREFLPQAREYVVYGSMVALGLEYFLSQTALEGYELLMLVVFGVLLGSGIGLMVGSRSEYAAGTLRRGGAILAGAILIALIPLRSFLGVAAPFPSVDLVLLGAGALLALAGALLHRSRLEASFVWLGGGILLFIMAVAREDTAGLSPPPESVVPFIWVAGASLMIGSFLLVLYQKWASATMAESIVSGDRQYRRQRYGESLRAYERAIVAAKKVDAKRNAEVPWYSKGAALVMLDRPEEALDCIEKALAINPRSEVAWVNKGTALSKMGKQHEALRCYNSAIKLNPTYEVAWNNKGNTLARLGKYEEAVRCYDEAIKLDEDYRDAWVNKGYVLVRIGDYEAAAECADMASRASTRVRVPSLSAAGR
jgi:tetratricopeptide (TPR) repeat protein/RNA polymerase subunit RPABC4/transcription elongation factor Spt4